MSKKIRLYQVLPSLTSLGQKFEFTFFPFNSLLVRKPFKSQVFSFFRIKILTLNIEEVGTTTTSITPFLLLKPFLLVGLLLSMSLDLSQLHKNGGKIFKLAVRLNRDLCFQGSIW